MARGRWTGAMRKPMRRDPTTCAPLGILAPMMTIYTRPGRTLTLILAAVAMVGVAIAPVAAAPPTGAAPATLAFEASHLSPDRMSDNGPGLSARIRQSGAHRWAGLATLGLATATAITGAIGVGEVHGPIAVTTLATGVVSSALGAIAYSDRALSVWPHPLMNGLALGGMLANLTLLETGSLAHRATGIASVGLLFGAYAYIVFAY